MPNSALPELRDCVVETRQRRDIIGVPTEASQCPRQFQGHLVNVDPVTDLLSADRACLT
ncbi:hypothetical protein ACFWPX_08805 [Nocardia sp. NPDC058518]|uniref:hypothetical protein n=1 Tax=Nocardia sp. NPDC058518 TaxID=3346534 RepID=UPI00364D90EA